MHPMLARTYGPRYNQFPCFIQPKLNGVRALYQCGTFQSRDEKLWRPGVLQHLIDALAPFTESLGNVILDGELYVHDWRLQRINSAVAVNRHEPTEDTPHVQFHVFDVVDPNRSFSDRWFDFYTPLILADHPLIRAVPTDHIWLKEEVDPHFRHWTKLGYEGIMLRPNGTGYEFGEHEGRNGPTTYRSKNLWKHKQWEDGEFVCVGVTQGEGKADIGIGALVCRAKDYVCPVCDGGPANHCQCSCPNKYEPVFNVGTGLSDSERIAFMANPPIGKLIKVRYLNLSADGIPLNPSFLAVL